MRPSSWARTASGPRSVGIQAECNATSLSLASIARRRRGLTLEQCAVHGNGLRRVFSRNDRTHRAIACKRVPGIRCRRRADDVRRVPVQDRIEQYHRACVGDAALYPGVVERHPRLPSLRCRHTIRPPSVRR